MIKITDANFNVLWDAALAANDRDTYVSDWATSSIWGLPEDLTDEDLFAIASKLGNIWDVAHMTVRDMCKEMSMTQSAFAQRFCIKKRTFEDWCRGARNPTNHERLMMAELLGLLER